MAQATQSGGKMAGPPVAPLRESPVDRVASLIVALLVLVGVLVLIMFSVWFSFKLAKPPQIAVPVRLDPGGGGDPNGVGGGEGHPRKAGGGGNGPKTPMAGTPPPQ